MKKLIYFLTISVVLTGCNVLRGPEKNQTFLTHLDLVNVQNDRVMVTLDPGEFSSEQTTFYMPKIVPGTYMESDYGQFAEDFRALDYRGREMEVEKLDENSWRISNADDLDKITYWVNDTFDEEGEAGIYSMAGTNIIENENYLLNLHGFVGYFEGMKEEEVRLEIQRPANLIPGTALTVASTFDTEEDNSLTDVYNLGRYFEVIDNPIMYATPDTSSFSIQGMEVLLNVYSPNNKYTSEDIEPAMRRMINAQLDFLGDMETTDKYAILLYLSEGTENGDAGNFGALEHHTSTVVVMPEAMQLEALNEGMTDIVAHEFFHIITPLKIHSNEIHYFDYNNPEMSQHLWMYEGVTEYFANLFQVNQDLISEQDFYDRMMDKINTSRQFDDTMSFTRMSENILEEEYQDSYYNVYMKGALIGMALDIRLRELSGGDMGILDLMKQLAERYGKDNPFEDDELIPTIVELTYPEIQDFFDTYVTGTTPIPYDEFFNKVALEIREGEVPVDYFLKDQSSPYITVNQAGNILVRKDIELNTFLQEVGIEPGDRIVSINGTNYNRENIYEMIVASQNWKAGDDIKVTVERDGEEITLESKIVEPMGRGQRLIEIPNADSDKIELRYEWLKS